MIAPEGYTPAAIERAHRDDANVILDVLNFKELEQFHGFGAIVYSGSAGALVQPPLGWIIDGTRRPGAVAWLYERGLSFDEACNSGEFMYINFWHKEEPAKDLASLYRHQESYLRDGPNPVTQIKFIEGVKRNESSAIRVAKFQNTPGGFYFHVCFVCSRCAG